METFMVLIPVSDSVANPRTACEVIESIVFKIDGKIRANEQIVLDKVMEELGIEEPHDIEVVSISDFMDNFNNDELNTSNTFMSYVYVEYESLAYLKN